MANVDDLVKKGFGQMGSVFTSVDGPIKPPTNKVFIAITFLANTTLDTAGGLIADTNYRSCEFAGTDIAAHNETGGSETINSGSGGDAIDVSDVFPAGVTIFGRWSEIDVGTGMIIAYIGE
tara:strand:- start:2163 stop:2525 length:363 start_codon:yes stop_codon:yes gene_type:complete